MKKKIFSTLLLVAFALASTSMFVSCKDYDDDITANSELIKQLQEQVARLEAFDHSIYLKTVDAEARYALKSDLQSLADKVGNLYTKQQVDDAIAAAKQTLQDAIDGKADASEVEGLRNQIATINQNLLTTDLLDERYGKLEDLTNAKTQIDNQQKVIKLLLEEAGTNGEITDANIAELKTLIDDLKAAKNKVDGIDTGDLAWLKTLKKAMEDANKTVADLIGNGGGNIINYLLDQKLSSLVSLPSTYINGIEAVELPVLMYQGLIEQKGEGAGEYYQYVGTTTAYNVPNYLDLAMLTDDGAHLKDGVLNQFKQNPWQFYQDVTAPARTGGYKFMSQDGLNGIAKYFVNPSTADLSNVTLSFYTNHPTAIEIDTRATADGQRYAPVNAKASENDYDGTILTVPFSFKDVSGNNGDLEAYVEQIFKNAEYLTKSLDGVTATRYSSKFDAIALQATVPSENGDTVITSDFQGVYPKLYHVTDLADNAPTNGIEEMRKCPGQPGEKGTKHLYITAAEAIKNPYTHSVGLYDVIDVKKFVETHISSLDIMFNDNGTFDYLDRVATQAELDALGLEYRYSIVHYNRSQYDPDPTKTDESLHIAQVAEGEKDARKTVEADNTGVFAPRSVTYEIDDKGVLTEKQLPAEEINESSLNREPLVKVELIHKKADGTEEIIEAGYIKLRIRLTPEDIEDVTVDIELPGTMYENCVGRASLEWSQVEYDILKKVGLSHQTFSENYTWNTDQYMLKDGKFVKIDGSSDNYYGDLFIYYHGDSGDPADVMTTTVVWDLAGQDGTKDKIGTLNDGYYENLVKASAPDWTEDGKAVVNTQAIATYLRIVAGDKAPTGDIYVKFFVPVNRIHFASGVVNNRSKTAGYWYYRKTDTTVADADIEPYQESETVMDVHVNVLTPNADDLAKDIFTNGPTSKQFTKDLLEYFRLDEKNTHDNIVTLYEKDKFDKFTYPAVQTKFYFTTPAIAKGNADFDANDNGEWTVNSNSGTVYTLKLNKVNKTDRKPTQIIIVKGVPSNGRGMQQDNINKILVNLSGDQNNVIEYGDITKDAAYNEQAFDILNYVRHDQLGDTETITAYIEIQQGDCYDAWLKNKYFNVRFLRPINWYPTKAKDVTDAPNEPQRFYIRELVDFTDWRTADTDTYTGETYPVIADNQTYPATGERPYTTPYAPNAKGGSWFKDHKEQTPDKYYNIVLATNVDEDGNVRNAYTDVVSGTPREMLDTKNKTFEEIEKTLKEKNVRFALTDKVVNLIFKYDDTNKEFLYQNNLGTVGEFNIYVPIYINYTFAPWNTEALKIKVWGTVHASHTVYNAKKN